MEQDATYNRKELCLALGVSRSGRYNHLHKADKGRRRENERLGARIVEIFGQSRGCYGWRRIQAMLQREGIRCGKERILRLMKRRGLRALQKRRFRPRTTQSRHEEPIAVNRLKGLEKPLSGPHEVWSADITYLPTLEEGWLYLAGQLDLFSKRLVGWKLDDCLASELVIEAFKRAVKTLAGQPANPSFRSGDTVCFGGLSPGVGPAPSRCQHERQRKLFGQCNDGELLGDPENRVFWR